MFSDMFDRIMTLAESTKRSDRMIAGAWLIAIAPATPLLAPLFCLAYGFRLIFGRKPL